MTKKEIKKLDKAWADRIKQIGRCENCGKTSYLNAHHVYTRRNRAVRWYIPNGICLCSGCHTMSSKFSAHQTPMDFYEFILNLRGEDWYYDLVKNKNKIFKGTYDDIMEYLINSSSLY